MGLIHISGYSLTHHPDLPDVTFADGVTAPAPFADWEYVMSGDLKEKLMGRIPMALYAARQENTQQIIWSTGSSMLPDGEVESTFMYRYLLDHAEPIVEAFADCAPRQHWFKDKNKLREWLGTRDNIFDTESLNTLDSVKWVARAMSNGRIRGRKVTFVTSGNHLSRVVRDVGVVFYEQYSDLCVDLSFKMAETCYGGGTMSDVIVRDLGT